MDFPRETSTGDVSELSSRSNNVSFLNTVKRTQRMNRLEKLRKTRSYKVPKTNNFNLEDQDAPPAPVSERTPLARGTKSAHAFILFGSEEDDRLFQNIRDMEDGKIKKEPTTKVIWEIVSGKGIVSACLLAAPLAVASSYADWGSAWVFWLNFVVMVPLASILGDFTEEVALHTNETVGGLINATFGNAVEVVVGIQALLANEIRVVQSSMLGSIFSNLLLVLGCCLFFGGLKHKEQTFNAVAASANMGLLALSSIALILPTPFAEYYELHDGQVLTISRFAAVFGIFMYAQLLLFQLKTHTSLFEGGEDDNELAAMPFWVGCVGLLTVTLAVTFFSEFLVGSIDGYVESSGISRTFVGVIILPIVGNAVEHVTAVSVAMKNKMDLAMGIALGSCTQISLFVLPLTVLVGWFVDRDMTLNFPHFEIVLFVMSIFTVTVVLSKASCNWLEGSLLCTVYCMLAVGFWFENVQDYT